MSVGRGIVATMWSGVEIVGVLSEGVADPSATTLDSIANALVPRNCGVKPTVRVLEHLAFRGPSDSGEPVCEGPPVMKMKTLIFPVSPAGKGSGGASVVASAAGSRGSSRLRRVGD